ncbi:hypothetical protein BGZ61DRAFT_9057 [Ilyonectria robusta]|uniref:uncharacterized protein n=1 Tax=Ilyonectria robusta TaxID=1079257 RepID=UPI001E8DCD12|nr:uncharacterized protein BGZ61DRAFT_9057 [Ilyonectria robusta]KAH8737086.1 hypothetical protein BGZ61DRAFT_9057 [Ilyonectria robusta]
MITEATPGLTVPSIEKLVTSIASLHKAETKLDSSAGRKGVAQPVAQPVAARFRSKMATHAAFPSSGGPGQSVVNGVMAAVSPSPSPNVSDSTLPNSAPASRPASSGSRLSAPPVTASMAVPSPYMHATHAPGSHSSPPLPQHMPHNGFPYQPQPGGLQAPPPQQAHPYHHRAQHLPHQQPIGPPSNFAPPPPPPVRGDVPSPNKGLTSPTATNTVQGSPEYHNLVNMVSAASPETVRQVIRDRWEKALLGSQYHVAFLLRSSGSVKHSSFMPTVAF